MNHKPFFLFIVITMHLYGSNWSTNYHSISDAQFSFAKSQLKNFKLQGNERVLDIGCGTGRTTYFFAEQLPHGSILGIDSSQDMIRFATQEYCHKDNLSFVLHDAENFIFNQEFDVVYSFFCLHWVKDKQAVLNNIVRALKKEGRVFIFVPVPSENFNTGIRYIKHVVDNYYPEWESCVNWPTNEASNFWIDNAQKAGLQVANMQIIKKETVYASKKKWNEYCCGLGIINLPEANKKMFIDKANTLLYKHYGLQDNDPYIRVTNIMVLELVKA